MHWESSRVHSLRTLRKRGFTRYSRHLRPRPPLMVVTEVFYTHVHTHTHTHTHTRTHTHTHTYISTYDTYVCNTYVRHLTYFYNTIYILILLI
jgi:hypothetical protein